MEYIALSQDVTSTSSSVTPEYQEVEYLTVVSHNNNFSSYIDTGISPAISGSTDVIRVTASFEMSSITYNGTIIGSINSSNQRCSPILFNASEQYFQMAYSGSHVKCSNIATSTRYNVVTTMFSFSQTMDVNGSTTNGSISGTISNMPTFYVFARHTELNSSGVDQQCAMTLYSLTIEIYRNGTWQIHTFVPCYRISDNVGGLLDTYDNTFKPNLGTYAFGLGPTVGGSSLNMQWNTVYQFTQPFSTLNITTVPSGHGITVFKGVPDSSAALSYPVDFVTPMNRPVSLVPGYPNEIIISSDTSLNNTKIQSAYFDVGIKKYNVTITITDSLTNSNTGYITVNGITYNSASQNCVISVDEGTVITMGVYGATTIWTTEGWVKINGNTVISTSSGMATYNYTVNNHCTISMTRDNKVYSHYGRITITTSNS